MEQTNEVHAALSRLRDAGIINKGGAPDQGENESVEREHGTDGTLALGQEADMPLKTSSNPIRRVWNLCTEPFVGIGNVLHELSPNFNYDDGAGCHCFI